MPRPILLATSLQADAEAAWRDALARAMPDETIAPADACPDRNAVEIAIVANPPAGSLRGLPALRWVHSLWAGVDRLVDDATLPPVPVVRLVDPALARAMAETVAAGILSLHRGLHLYAAQQRRRAWQPHAAVPTAGRIVTILGLGEMGRAAAALLVGLGFSVRGWSRSAQTVPGVATFAGPDRLADALAGAAFLVNLLPLTPETRGVLCAATFDRLAPGAGLINFGRGAHLVEADLWTALGTGRIGHAILDVFEVEPLPPEHPAWTHPGVSVLPHVAAPTSLDSAAGIVADAVAAFRRTGVPPRGIDRARGY